jgi:ADP-ribose pyrophosphatase YjhB (NUDIX family)
MEVRKSSRLIIVNPDNKLLLFSYCDEHSGQFWATVGGELVGSETYLDAAKRELYEETGLIQEVGRFLRDREDVYAVARSEPAQWLEKYFLVNWPADKEVRAEKWSDEECSTIQKWKWWSLSEIMQEAQESFKPEWLPELFEKVLLESSMPNKAF